MSTKLKNILAENMRRFGTKNLDFKTIQNLNRLVEQQESETTVETIPFKDIWGYDVNSLSTVSGQYPMSVKYTAQMGTPVKTTETIYAYNINGEINVLKPFGGLGDKVLYIYDKPTFESIVNSNGGWLPGEDKAKKIIENPSADITNKIKEQSSSIRIEFNENAPKISLSSLKGKPFILDFWATWCHACKKNIKNIIMPLYGDVRQQGDTDLSLYFYSVDKDVNVLKSYVDQNIKGLGINVVGENNTESEGVKTYNVTRYPTTLVFDKDGNNLGELPQDLEAAKKMVYPLLGLEYKSDNINPTPMGRED